ncbi:MAG: superoxide dismutase [Bacteroidetes bacterium GWA2_30_7]|nr:MAG: superoxide dismutase [Bacteroidetes bacterium GWA2_30_7]
MKFELPKLPYELNKLEPVISAKTFEFHYGKHHQAYVNNLNNLVPGTPFENASLETIIKEADGGIFNNAAQIWNHTFYFLSFSPNGGGEPKGKLAALIIREFDSFDLFKEKFTKAAATLFGSGWVWLVLNKDGKLEITQENNAGCPLKHGLKPLLTIDVWEHAYYLDYQNRRPDYISAFWNIIDWNVIEGRV